LHFGPRRYSSVDPRQFAISMDIVPLTAQLSLAPQSGYVTRFTVHAGK
jgi:hypothetical protein